MYMKRYIVNREYTLDRDVEEVHAGTQKKLDNPVQTNIFSASGIRVDFNNKYNKMDDQSDVWDKAIIEVVDNPTALAKILKANKTKLRGIDFKIYLLVNYFGSIDIQNEEKIELLHRVKNHPEIASIAINGTQIKITKIDGTEIKSTILSKEYAWLAGDFALDTAFRMNKCHQKSIKIASNLGGDAKVVTGTVLGLTTKSKYLHSWVEATIDNKPMVIDYTMNSIMNHDGFYSIRNAEAISKIDHKDLTSDLEILLPYIDRKEISLKEYLTYPERVMGILTENEI